MKEEWNEALLQDTEGGFSTPSVSPNHFLTAVTGLL